MAIPARTYDRFSPSTTTGPYRRTDYETLPDDERCELLNGRLYLLSGPDRVHQIVSLLLGEILLRAARKSRGSAFMAPLDVFLADHTIVQPDAIYIAPGCRATRGRFIEGPPSLVIEVQSPSSDRRDRIEKTQLYATGGVEEFWLVDPTQRTIEFLVNERGHWQVELTDGALYRSRLFPEIEIDLDLFWREVVDMERR